MTDKPEPPDGWCKCKRRMGTLDKWPAICLTCRFHVYDESVARLEEHTGRRHPATWLKYEPSRGYCRVGPTQEEGEGT